MLRREERIDCEGRHIVILESHTQAQEPPPFEGAPAPRRDPGELTDQALDGVAGGGVEWPPPPREIA